MAINNRIDIGIEYLDLGKPEVGADVSFSVGDYPMEMATSTISQRIVMFNLSVGVRF